MKNCAGFDIGNHALHIAVKKNDKIVRSIVERLAEGMVQNGRITSLDAMSDAIKEVKKTQKIRVRNASVVLPAGLCYCRRFTVSAMSKEQLVFNLPYEFHDFITDDKRNYFFDYAVVDIIKNEDGTPKEYDLIGAATRKDVIADYSRMFAKAGFKLKAAIPEELAYVNVLRAHGGEPHRHGILDIGHNAVRLFMFTGDRFESIRVIDYGCNALDVVISEKFGVDDHYLSATYRENNYENATELPGCLEIYNAMAIEVLKAVNFYRFNGGGRLEHLHLCGGGVKIEALVRMLRRLPIEITDLSEFIPQPEGVDSNVADITANVAAAPAENAQNAQNVEPAQETPLEQNAAQEAQDAQGAQDEEPAQEETPAQEEAPEQDTQDEESAENAEESAENAEEPAEDSEEGEEPTEESAQGEDLPQEGQEAPVEETEQEAEGEPSQQEAETPSESEGQFGALQENGEENLTLGEEKENEENAERSFHNTVTAGKDGEPVDYAMVILAAGAVLQ